MDRFAGDEYIKLDICLSTLKLSGKVLHYTLSGILLVLLVKLRPFQQLSKNSRVLLYRRTAYQRSHSLIEALVPPPSGQLILLRCLRLARPLLKVLVFLQVSHTLL